MDWIVGDHVGLSSTTIWSALMGCQPSRPSVPYDVADFKRCWMLLMECDTETQKLALVNVAKRHEIWKPYVERWRYMTDLFVVGNYIELSKVLKALRPCDA